MQNCKIGEANYYSQSTTVNKKESSIQKSLVMQENLGFEDQISIDDKEEIICKEIPKPKELELLNS